MEDRREQDTLGLRAQGIGDDDMARLAVFLRIGSDQLVRRWRIASDERFDALLLGQDETLPMPLGGPVGGGLGTLRLVDADQFDAEPGQLRRPLAFEALIEQLQWLERQVDVQARMTSAPPVLDEPIEAATGPAASDAVSDSRAGAPGRREETGVEPGESAAPDEAPLPSPSRGPDRTATGRVVDEMAEFLSRGGPPDPLDADSHTASNAPVLRHGDFYVLKRMPTVVELTDDRCLQTVAGLLTIRPVQLGELAAQSGLDRADCETALRRLMALGVLHVTDARPPPPRERSAARRRRTEPAPAKAEDPPLGVMARLRGRLGLGDK